ncbi:MAG: hypothetical protein Q4G07_03335, partial [Oscillospiraceae bacterium]|nr:hypothetical protein [Oscillospiraceae bacterium]
MKRITAILTAFLLLMLTACAPPETVKSISQPVQSAAESISPPVQSAGEEALPPAALGGRLPLIQAFSASAPGEED